MADALVIRGLSKRFGGLRAVQDVSFTVQENETVALIGPNGAGKTTSFNLITGFHRPDTGSVSAFGREIVGLRPHDVCAHGLARTFQVGKLSQRGLTIVIVEHVMRAIMAVARHIVVLDHGQKIAEGTPKEIVENPEVIRAYLGSYVHPPAAEA